MSAYEDDHLMAQHMTYVVCSKSIRLLRVSDDSDHIPTYLWNLREACTTLSSHFLSAVICDTSADFQSYTPNAYRDHQLDTTRYTLVLLTRINEPKPTCCSGQL